MLGCYLHADSAHHAAPARHAADTLCCPALRFALPLPCDSHSPVRNSARLMAQHAECLRRFDTVVAQLKAHDSDELWVSLGSCNLQDARMAALTEALSHNSTVTALDLSRNNITNEGAQVTASA